MKKTIPVLLTLALAASPATADDIIETAKSNGSFNTLVAAVQAAGLVETLQGDGPFTVFAPTDDAFAKLPKETLESLLQPENKDQLTGILTYHVASGRLPANQVVGLSGVTTVNGQRIDISTENGATVDGANVIATDVMCDNGIIHVIDSVILPASNPLPVVAKEAGQFNTLLAAVGAAGLAETLSGEGPFTVFAPTDDAFANLPEGTVESLLKPENKQQLTDVLKYHVVSGRVYSDKALEAKQADTLFGEAVNIQAENGTATVNNAKLLSTDIDASNGVIHVIDTVLMPGQNKQAATHPPASSQSHPHVNSGVSPCQQGPSPAASQSHGN